MRASQFGNIEFSYLLSAEQLTRI